MKLTVELPDDTLTGFVNFVYGDMFGLTTVPVNDGNYIYALTKYASVANITEAIKIMKSRNGTDKSRITACERELRKRLKIKEKEQ